MKTRKPKPAGFFLFFMIITGYGYHWFLDKAGDAGDITRNHSVDATPCILMAATCFFLTLYLVMKFLRAL